MLIHQPKDWGLGNFINLTPTIKRIFEREKTPVDVFFESNFVKECFIDCPWINIVDNLYEKPLLGSAFKSPRTPDYQAIFKNFHGEYWNPKYHTYIDSPKEYDFSSKENYLVVVNGCAEGIWEGKKETPEHIHRLIKEYSNLPIYYIGSTRDLEKNSPWMKELADVIELDNIRKCLSIIRDSTKIIANDTGLAHAAGALNKDILILWKDSDFFNAQNPGKNTQYAQKYEWEPNIVNFLT